MNNVSFTAGRFTNPRAYDKALGARGLKELAQQNPQSPAATNLDNPAPKKNHTVRNVGIGALALFAVAMMFPQVRGKAVELAQKTGADQLPKKLHLEGAMTRARELGGQALGRLQEAGNHVKDFGLSMLDKAKSLIGKGGVQESVKEVAEEIPQLSQAAFNNGMQAELLKRAGMTVKPQEAGIARELLANASNVVA